MPARMGPTRTQDRRRRERRVREIEVAHERRWLPDRRRGERRGGLVARLRCYFG